MEEIRLCVSRCIISAFFAYSSPAASLAPGESCRIPLSQFVRNSALRHSNAISVPSTPELHVRRQYTQSFRYAETSAALLKQHTKMHETKTAPLRTTQVYKDQPGNT